MLRKTLTILSVIGLLLSVGCDKVKFGTQRVEVTVTKVSSGLPLSDARVSCAPRKRMGASTLYDLSTEEYLDRFNEESLVTDSSGRAVFPLDVFVVRGGIFVWLGLDPVNLEDTVTGEVYLFRIKRDVQETLTVRMVPGQSAEGTTFTLAVDTIAPPQPRAAP